MRVANDPVLIPQLFKQLCVTDQVPSCGEESQDQDIPTQVPRTNYQDTRDSALVEWLQGPGACKIPERIDREVIDDASQDNS